MKYAAVAGAFCVNGRKLLVDDGVIQRSDRYTNFCVIFMPLKNVKWKGNLNNNNNNKND